MPYADLRKGRYSATGRIYHVTIVTMHRCPRFHDLTAARRVVLELKALQEEELADTFCYVVMPEHLHWLLLLRETTLGGVVKPLKGRTSRALGGNLWQPGYHDHALRADEDLKATARYIVANPLRARLVSEIGEYPHWDAVWLEQTLSD